MNRMSSDLGEALAASDAAFESAFVVAARAVADKIDADFMRTLKKYDGEYADLSTRQQKMFGVPVER